MSKACKKPRSRAKPAPSIPPFLHKIYEILENPTYNDLASWNPEGDAFMIKNVTEFTEKVLPEYFKHKNFASFVRQLNLYGFHKSRYENNGSEFHHKFFKRGERHLLTDIKRKGPNEDPSDSSSPFAPAPDEMETERQVQMPFINMNSLQDIIARQERLESAMKIIYTENKHLKRDNKMLWNEVIKVKTKQSNTEKATRAIHEQNTQLLKDNQGLWGELIRTREKHERQVEKLLLFLISIFNYSGANPAGLLQKKNMRGSTFNGTQEEDIQYQYENVPTDNQVLSIMPAKPNKNYNRKTKSHLDTLFERLEKDSKNSFLATIFEEKDFTNKLASLLESEPGKTGMSSLEYLMDKRSAPLDYSFEGDDKTTSKFCNKENQSWDPSAVFIDEEKGAIPHYNFDKPPTMEELTHDIQDVNLHSPMNLEAGSDFDMPPLKNEDNGNFTNRGLFNPFNRGINEDDQDSLCDDEEEKKDPFAEGNTYFEPNYENPQNFLERMDSGRFDDNAPWFSPTNFLRRNSNLSEMGQNRFFNPSRNNSGLDLSI